jgi:hypothetical protein
MEKFNLTEDLNGCYITNARIFDVKIDKFKSNKALRISSRNECILVSDIQQIIKNLKQKKELPKYIQTYGHKGGGVYYRKDSWAIEDCTQYVMFGCQRIYKSNILSLKMK